MDEMDLIDPNLIFIGSFLTPIVTELFTNLNAESKVKQWVATAVTAAVILISTITHALMGNIDINSAPEVYELVAFLLAQFGIVRASVEGGHRGFDAVERATGRSLETSLLPNVGFGAETAPKDAQ